MSKDPTEILRQYRDTRDEFMVSNRTGPQLDAAMQFLMEETREKLFEAIAERIGVEEEDIWWFTEIMMGRWP